MTPKDLDRLSNEEVTKVLGDDPTRFNIYHDLYQAGFKKALELIYPLQDIEEVWSVCNDLGIGV